MAGWDLSCPDWEARILAGRSLMPELPLLRDEAEIAVEFFDNLCLPDVPGTPSMREAGGEWFREVVRAVFGSYDPIAKTRYIEEIFALVPKKNSKTTNFAGLMLTAMFMNRRRRAEFLFIGPTQAIADLAFSQTEGMIQLDEALAKRFRIRDHLKEIVDLTNGAKLKIKTFDLNVLTGPRPAGALIDELHLLGRNPATAKVLRQLRGGRQSVPEGFLIIATTQSDEAPTGAFREELMAARAIRDGSRGGVMLPILYELPLAIARDQARWGDSKNWHMVMPNLGRSLRLDSLERDFAAEREKGEAALRLWASQHLNIEIGLGLHSDRWAGADYWEDAAEPGLTLEVLIARSEVAVVGIDGGGLDDLLGLAVIGREKRTGRWLLWNRAWAHPIVLQRRKSEAARLRELSAGGEIALVERLGDDIAGIIEIVSQLKAARLLPAKNAVGLDPVGVAQIVEALREIGLSEDQIVGISQGWKLSGAIKTVERKLADKSLVHAGQALMNWCVGNAKVEPRGNAITITKQAAGTAKIDPLMASFNAGALLPMLLPDPKRPVTAFGVGYMAGL